MLENIQKVLFLIGPSGVGKSTVLKELSKRGIIELTPSWTTRPPRSDENHESIEHKFISTDEFSELENDGFFLETLQLFNLPYKFGLPRVNVKQPGDNKTQAMVLRTYLVPRMFVHYPNGLVYALEDDFSKVESRLRSRLSAGEPLGSRLEEYQSEIETGRKVAQRTFSNDSTIEKLADKLEEAIRTDFI